MPATGTPGTAPTTGPAQFGPEKAGRAGAGQENTNAARGGPEDTGTPRPSPASREVRRAELNRGQRYFWLHHHQLPADARHDTHIVLDPPLPEGLAPARVRAALNLLVRRHEGMRTTFPVGEDGLPRQIVHAPAPLPVRVVAADGGGAVAEAVRDCSQRDFDLAAEWPVRACLVTVDGRVRRLVLVLNHISFDDWSIAALLRELDALLTAAAAGRPAALPPVLCQPADLPTTGTAQDGAPGTAQDIASGTAQDGAPGTARDAVQDTAPRGPADGRRAPWRAEAARLPSDLYAARRTSAEARESYSATLTSPRLLPAAREVAGRLQVWPSAVHMAAFTALTAVYTGSPVVPFWLFSSHRGDAPTMDVLTCMFDPLLTAVRLPDGDDPTFGEIVRATADAVRHAQERPPLAYDETLELLAEEAGRRGRPVRVETEVNFLNHAPRSCGTRRTRFARNPEPVAWARSGADAYFRVHEWADGVTLALRASGAVLSAHAVERFLRGCEELITKQADTGDDLRLSELAGLSALPEPAADATGHDTASPDTALPGAAVPGAATADTGAPRTPGPAAPGAEEALLRAVAEAGGPAAPDAGAGYVAGGGRLLRAPAVLAALHAAGWNGLSVRDLAGPLPLRDLAGLLVAR
ncbi:condensation domain-containing protein [Streptomyces sp. NPDC006186]|uniref:condensation domain-containing protein n=1 Tax=Streptomyces sp. NPDC006186 TaxID=3155248 RepID=UPI0033B101A9